MYMSCVLVALGDSGELHKHRGAETAQPCGYEVNSLGTNAISHGC